MACWYAAPWNFWFLGLLTESHNKGFLEGLVPLIKLYLVYLVYNEVYAMYFTEVRSASVMFGLGDALFGKLDAQRCNPESGWCVSTYRGFAQS